MNNIEQTLAAVSLAPVIQFRNLAVFPLLGTASPRAEYLTLDESLEAQLAHITEVSEAGSVPELAFENGADCDVLLLDGEELVGARQNRIINITILVGAGQKLVIPVSCVERGRWSYRSREFASAKRKLFARARAAKMAQVSRSMERDGRRNADQSAIWEDISLKAASLDACSATESMSEIYAQRNDAIAGFQNAIQAIPGQIGAVFAVDGAVRGLELFDVPNTFAKFLEKLTASYAMDAIDTNRPVETGPSLEEVRTFLARVQMAAAKRFPAIGKGEDVRLEAEGLAGGALVVDGRVVHLAAFALDGLARGFADVDFECL